MYDIGQHTAGGPNKILVAVIQIPQQLVVDEIKGQPLLQIPAHKPAGHHVGHDGGQLFLGVEVDLLLLVENVVQGEEIPFVPAGPCHRKVHPRNAQGLAAEHQGQPCLHPGAIGVAGQAQLHQHPGKHAPGLLSQTDLPVLGDGIPHFFQLGVTAVFPPQQLFQLGPAAGGLLLAGAKSAHMLGHQLHGGVQVADTEILLQKFFQYPAGSSWLFHTVSFLFFCKGNGDQPASADASSRSARRAQTTTRFSPSPVQVLRVRIWSSPVGSTPML